MEVYRQEEGVLQQEVKKPCERGHRSAVPTCDARVHRNRILKAFQVTTHRNLGLGSQSCGAPDKERKCWNIQASLRFSCGLRFGGKERNEGLSPSFKMHISTVRRGHMRSVWHRPVTHGSHSGQVSI